MSEAPEVPSNGNGDARARIPAWLVAVAGVPLLAAMLAEFAAVVGRNSGWNFIGSIELVQALILLSSCGAMVAATISRSHAKVTVLSRRYRGRSGRALRFLIALGGVVFYLSLAAGSAWIAVDMWHASEQSELLGIPYLPLRCVAAVSMFAVAALYGLRVVREMTHR